MGTEWIEGSFISGDWNYVINSGNYIKFDRFNNKYRQCTNNEISKVLDWIFYDGENMSKDDIWKYIYKNQDYLYEERHGMMVIGKCLWYNLCTPQIEKLNYLPFDYKRYVQPREYSVLKMRKVWVFEDLLENRIEMIYHGSLENCKRNVLNCQLNNSPLETFIICGYNGIHYRCYNKIKTVKTTTRKTEIGKLTVCKVNKYYWGAGIHT